MGFSDVRILLHKSLDKSVCNILSSSFTGPYNPHHLEFNNNNNNNEMKASRQQIHT